jgi:hypothetical protein
VFYPSRSLGFGSEGFVEVTYDGQSLARTQFQVRPLPTFVVGSLSDQFGQPLADITVELPELGRRAVTNGDGSFAFGFQEAADQFIPGGRYRLQVNAGLKTPGFGSLIKTVNLQEGRRNALGRLSLQELNRTLPFQFLNIPMNKFRGFYGVR